jgi:predicted metal-binding membrane protein
VLAAGWLLAVAWLGCVWVWVGGGVERHGTGGGGVWWCMPGMATGSGGRGVAAGAVLAGLPGWLLMSVAMTLPGVLPAAQHVAVNTMRRRRSLAVGVFLVVYLLLWLAAGAASLAVFAVLDLRATVALAAVTLALAAAYELTGVKRTALNRCHRTIRLPPSGWRAGLAAGRFGWVNASGCVGSCWVSMGVMLTLPAARPAGMLLLTGTMTFGRLARRPDRARRRVATVYTVAAALLVILAV